MRSKDSSFELSEHFASFVEAQVSQGNYASTSDVLCAGLRLLEERESKLLALRNALVEGETSGASAAFDFDAFIAKKRDNAKRT